MRARTFLVCALVGCGHPVAFQGQTTIPITSTPVVKEAAVPPRVEVRDDKIEIHEKIQFDYDKDVIKEASFGLMDEIADVIKKNPQIKRIRIEGHASSEGNAAHNKKLSDDRAKSVMKYLSGHGIPVAELTSVGYGADRPIADNATEDGRERNRRVEFLILEQEVTQKKVEVDPKTGSEKVVEEKHATVTAPDAGATNNSGSKGEP